MSQGSARAKGRRVSREVAEQAVAKPTRKIYLYVPTETVAELEKMAAADRRSLSEFLRWHLVDWVAEQLNPDGPAPQTTPKGK